MRGIEEGTNSGVGFANITPDHSANLDTEDDGVQLDVITNVAQLLDGCSEVEAQNIRRGHLLQPLCWHGRRIAHE